MAKKKVEYVFPWIKITQWIAKGRTALQHEQFIRWYLSTYLPQYHLKLRAKQQPRREGGETCSNVGGK